MVSIGWAAVKNKFQKQIFRNAKLWNVEPRESQKAVLGGERAVRVIQKNQQKIGPKNQTQDASVSGLASRCIRRARRVA